MRLAYIPPEHVPQAWAVIAPFAEQIAGRFEDDWPVPIIAEAAAAGDLQLRLIGEDGASPIACVGTRIAVKASGKRVFEIAWVAGRDRRKWLHLKPELEAIGARHGCAESKITGRWGWKDDLPDYECDKLAIYTKELT